MAHVSDDSAPSGSARLASALAGLPPIRRVEKTDIGAAAAAETLAAAREMLAAGHDAADDDVWRQYLERTRRPDFLVALPDDDARREWAETTYAACERIDYTLADMLRQRADETPRRDCFEVIGGGRWNYESVLRRVRSFAAVWHTQEVRRVAIWAANGLDTACSDLACLLYDIVVTPLNVAFDDETVAWILRRCASDIVVTDSPERVRRLREIALKEGLDFQVCVIGTAAEVETGARNLAAEAARLGAERVDAVLAGRPRLARRDIATVMFTSGSTGRPKGVAFSIHNLVTKRFARAAALPAVGDNEVFFCYLPLFHTFGRYLEMLGAIFWGGTYVFAGNPSSDTLLARFRKVRPTALISIPLRWLQIYERITSTAGDDATDVGLKEAFDTITGGRLRWGLSAAGYLAPHIFRFFNRQGVQLCSGFGMTEATGGITMTQPGGYRDGSVGVPLPGIRAKLAEQDELHITGPYVAGYIDPDGEPGVFAPQDAGEHWLPTGDVFRQHEDGHLEIVDRIKDIYKNNRGQTVAPRKVEQRFDHVPGVKRVFLVGDGRACNTLLIVPDPDDPVLASAPSPQWIEEYFQRIVADANTDLAGYERVVNFTLIDRDFSADEDELTAKDSYKRKNIEANFAETIASLYESRVVELDYGDLTVVIPRWFFGELGILETDIAIESGTTGDRLVDRRRDMWLDLGPKNDEGAVRVGDLRYLLDGDVIDLGLFVRQPLLWAGNPRLQAFYPCKAGWDTPTGPVGEQIVLPRSRTRAMAEPAVTDVAPMLTTIASLAASACFGDSDESLAATRTLGKLLADSVDETGDLIRRRLEALARHPEEGVRCLAYRILVLDNPTPDFQRFLPTFIASGNSFLCEDSISKIARANIEPRGLLALRRRLATYRSQLEWPASAEQRRIFTDLFHLLSDFARYHPRFYGPVREELVSWILHEGDEELSRRARGLCHDLAEWFEDALETESALDPAETEGLWAERIVLQSGLSASERDRIVAILTGPAFLKESILLACGGEVVEPGDIAPGGVWVSRILSLRKYSRYRVSVNTNGGRHFDLGLIVREDLDEDWILDTIYRHIAIRGYPTGAPILPRFGCCRPEQGAISLAYASDLNVWEKVREFASNRGPDQPQPAREQWQRLYVSGMAAFMTAWRNSGRTILPGNINPSNVVVPEPDFREGNHVVSLTGWKPYTGPASLIEPMLRNFFQQAESHYPWLKRVLGREWICEACVEALGVDEALEFLADVRGDVETGALPDPDGSFATILDEGLDRLRRHYYAPMPLEAAIRRYQHWQRITDRSTWDARLDILDELQRLYRLDRLPEIARYHLFRHTCFRQASLPLLDAFDRLLMRLFRDPKVRATRLVELSDLQSRLSGADERRAFRRLAFPASRPTQEVEIEAVGTGESERVIVKTRIVDRRGLDYSVHDATEPAEIGQLYRLFMMAGYPKTIGERDRFLIAVNRDEQIIGGVCYRQTGEDIVHLDGIVVASALSGRGLSSALLEDFCARQADLGMLAVMTHFFLRKFYQKRGFDIDRRWGGLVRFLSCTS